MALGILWFDCKPEDTIFIDFVHLAFDCAEKLHSFFAYLTSICLNRMVLV